MDILSFAYQHMETIFAGTAGLGIAIFMATRKIKKSDNDLTQRIIKLKRYTDSVNQRTKSVL